jgi:hypothetical protein
LAIYAFANPEHSLPSWYDVNDKQLMADLAEITRIADAKKRRNIEQFRQEVERGEVLELPNAAHYVVQSNQEEVVAAIERFVSRVEGE